MAGAVLAALALTATPAGAGTGPLWPCEVSVWIEPGPFHDAAVVALGQLDAATVISWPLVEEGAAMVRVEVGATLTGGEEWVGATATTKVGGGMVLDSSTPNRWVMTGWLHGLGHVAGLDHNDEERSVMNATDVPWRRFTTSDLARLAEVECHG